MRLYLGAMLLKRAWILAGFSDDGMDCAPKGTESGFGVRGYFCGHGWIVAWKGLFLRCAFCVRVCLCCAALFKERAAQRQTRAFYFDGDANETRKVLGASGERVIMDAHCKQYAMGLCPS